MLCNLYHKTFPYIHQKTPTQFPNCLLLPKLLGMACIGKYFKSYETQNFSVQILIFINIHFVSINKLKCPASMIITKQVTQWKQYITIMYLLMHLCTIPSKLLGANLLLTTNCGCPPKDPLVPISDGKNVITCSAA